MDIARQSRHCRRIARPRPYYIFAFQGRTDAGSNGAGKPFQIARSARCRSDLSTARNIGLEALAMLIGAPEWKEGMAAFMEKREPRFG
jgi:hypothetical protein